MHILGICRFAEGHLCVMDIDRNRAKRQRSFIVRAQSLARIVRERATRAVATSQEVLRSEDARWRALVTIGRFTAHLAILCVLVATIILAGSGSGAAGATRAAPSRPVGEPANGAQNGAQDGPSSPIIVSRGGLFGGFQQAGASEQDVSLIVRSPVFEVVQPSAARTGIITYTVVPGDNVETIAQRFGLLPTTIVWSNRDVEDNPDVLRVGQVLTILPVDGIWYTVEADDTLSGIAERFKVKVEDILNSPLNNLSSGANLLPGTRIVVPGGVKPFVPRVVQADVGRLPVNRPSSYTGAAPRAAGSGAFAWPTRGVISQGFRYYHRAIDIANAIGIPIAAADGGYVIYAGWSEVGYGYMVQIDHGNGFTTLYAHLSQWYVDPGQPVSRGQIIGAMGSTGNSTGPHLHFEIRYGGVPQNPLVYLP